MHILPPPTALSAQKKNSATTPARSELASPRVRLWSAVVDMMVFAGVVMIAGVMAWLVEGDSAPAGFSMGGVIVLLGVSLQIWMVFLYGKSFGKWIFKLKLIGEDGGAISLWAFFLHYFWMPLSVPLTLPILYVFSLFCGKGGQAVHDIFSRTKVVVDRGCS